MQCTVGWDWGGSLRQGRSVWVGMDGLQRGLFGLALNSLADDGKTVDQFVRHNLVNHSNVSSRGKQAPCSLKQHAVPFLVMLIDTRHRMPKCGAKD